MSNVLNQKLEEFRKRASEINAIIELAEQKKKVHQDKTRADFGIAENDTMSLESMVKAISVVFELKNAPEPVVTPVIAPLTSADLTGMPEDTPAPKKKNRATRRKARS